MKKFISSKKLKELKNELELLKTVKRQEIACRIQEAQTRGDITESAEYTEAKEAQAFNEGRIIELGQLIEQAVVVSKKRKKDKVGIGTQITVKSKKGKEEFIIVGSGEANPQERKISNESPLGKAFLDLKVGDEAEVETPAGKVKYKILKIK